MVCLELSRRQNIIFALLLATSFIIGVNLSLPAPFLPKLNEKHNLTSETTWMISVYPIFRLVTVPFLAKYMTAIGLYEVTCFGLLFNGGNTIIFGLIEYFPCEKSQTDWTYILFGCIIRAFQSIGSCASTTAGMTIISMAFPRSTTTVMALFEAMFCVGAMVGPALGSGLYNLGGFAAVFIAVGAVQITLSIFLFVFLPKVQKGNHEVDAQSIRSILCHWQLSGPLFILIFGAAMWSSWDPILEPELRNKFGLTPEISALCFLALAGVYGICCPLVGKVLDKKYCKDGLMLMAIGLLVSTAAFFFAGPSPLLPIGFSRPLPLLLFCVGLIGLACGLVHISSLNLVYTYKDGMESHFTAMFSLIPQPIAIITAQRHNSISLLIKSYWLRNQTTQLPRLPDELLGITSLDDDESNIDSESRAATNSIISALWGGCFAAGDMLGPITSGSIVKVSSFAWAMTCLSGLSFLFFIFTVLILIASRYKVILGTEQESKRLLPRSTKSTQSYQKLLKDDLSLTT